MGSLGLVGAGGGLNEWVPRRQRPGRVGSRTGEGCQTDALHSMTGMIFAASVSLWRTTAVTNATTAVQQSSRFAAPALTDAVPRMVTTPCLIAIAASPMDDRMWDAGSSPTQMVSTTFGETLGSSLWWDRMCSGKYPVAVHQFGGAVV